MSWDEDGTPHPLALRRTGRSELEPDRLPEIRELEVLGWEPAPEDLRWVFLPYVWPPAARTWIPDRSTHWAVDTSLDGHGHITGVECAPLPEPDLRDLDREADAALADLGLPPRPPGRLWLLRPVGPFDTVEAVLDHLDALAAERAVSARPSTAFLALARTGLAALHASTLVVGVPAAGGGPMRRRHHFHIEHAGHSVSATVQTGHTSVVDVLVDGKETGHATTRGDHPVTVRVELPTDPPTPVSVRATPGPGLPRCLFEAPATEPHIMSPRPY